MLPLQQVYIMASFLIAEGKHHNAGAEPPKCLRIAVVLLNDFDAHAVCLFRQILDDTRHIEFSRRFLIKIYDINIFHQSVPYPPEACVSLEVEPLMSVYVFIGNMLKMIMNEYFVGFKEDIIKFCIWQIGKITRKEI